MDGGARLDGDPFDHAGVLRRDHVLHLHRLDHEQRLLHLDGVTRRDVDGDDRPLHRSVDAHGRVGVGHCRFLLRAMRRPGV